MKINKILCAFCLCVVHSRFASKNWFISIDESLFVKDYSIWLKCTSTVYVYAFRCIDFMHLFHEVDENVLPSELRWNVNELASKNQQFFIRFSLDAHQHLFRANIKCEQDYLLLPVFNLFKHIDCVWSHLSVLVVNSSDAVIINHSYDLQTCFPMEQNIFYNLIP